MCALNSEERKSHFRNIVAMVSKDGVIGDQEQAMLAFTAAKWGLSNDEAGVVLTNPDAVELHIPESGEDRFQQLYDLTEAMIIDGVMKAGEKQFCEKIALELKFKISAVQQIVDGILEGNLSASPESEIQQRLREVLLG